MFHSASAISTGAVMVLVACSSGSATGPTTSRNAQLIAHFDSLAVGAQPLRATEFRMMSVSLALGAPVVDATITLNGTARHYSLIAQYDVNDPADAPFDSTLSMFAWRGSNADTIVAFWYADGGSVELSLSTPSTFALVPFGPGTGSALVSSQGGGCTSFLNAVGPTDTVPSGVSCRLETIAVSATGTLQGGNPSSQTLTFAQPVTAVRVGFPGGN